MKLTEKVKLLQKKILISMKKSMELQIDIEDQISVRERLQQLLQCTDKNESIKISMAKKKLIDKNNQLRALAGELNMWYSEMP